jgi:UDP-N-acetylmuramoylalanine--D-glutamate ligase
MTSVPQNILVIGLGESGQAAALLAAAGGACVTAADSRPASAFSGTLDNLRAAGVAVETGAEVIPSGGFDLAVVSPGLSPRADLYRSLSESDIPVIGELEFGWSHIGAPTVAITGTNGKTTTTELITHMLYEAGQRTVAAGNIGLPASRVALGGAVPERLVLEVSSFQLETTTVFDPEVSVLLNITPDHLDRHGSTAEYARIKARILSTRRTDAVAVVQSEALAYLRSLKVEIPRRLVTFSSGSRKADLYFEDGLVMGGSGDWKGPLLSLQQTRLRGGHNAENIMAAMAVGREFGLSLEQMVRSVKTYRPAEHRIEPAGEINGVIFVNDSKATNLDAMMRAIEAMSSMIAEEPNILLIAGGSGKGLEFHEAGPLLSRRVKAAFLIGESRESMKAAWSLFTSCNLAGDLEEAVMLAVEMAEIGDVVLLSPACASFDQFTGYAHRGDCFKAIVADLMNTTYGAPLLSRSTTDCGPRKTASKEHLA